MKRLCQRALAKLPAEVKTPQFDRTQATGIVHLGAGAFHRAHQAAYVDDLLEHGHRGWMIEGASLRSSAVSRQLNPQDGLYSVCIKSNGDDRYNVLGAIKQVIVAVDDPRLLVAKLASSSTKLVSITVTEKGYCLDPASGLLNARHPAIVRDIGDIDRPTSMPGFLVAALSARKENGLEPFTVLSCDNLPNNGGRTKNAVVGLAERVSPTLARWIEKEATFPSSMVDRIVPATTEADRERCAARFGISDEGLVSTEPFSQWVIEDKFCNARPALEKVGVQFVDDVGSWETLKLRVLNGAHSSMAYLGGLVGVELVSEMLSVPGYRKYLNALWDETEQTLPADLAAHLPGYRSQLVERFCNIGLKHRTAQIAVDGSQKLPQRLIAPLLQLIRTGRKAPALTLAVAAWVLWLRGKNELGAAHVIDDPLQDVLEKIAAGSGDDINTLVRGVVNLRQVFGDAERQHRQLQKALVVAVERLQRLGVRGALASL